MKIAINHLIATPALYEPWWWLPGGTEWGTALLHLGAVNPKTIIPIHYERSVWSHFRESVESYQHEFEKAGLRWQLKWLEHGKQTLLEV